MSTRPAHQDPTVLLPSGYAARISFWLTPADENLFPDGTETTTVALEAWDDMHEPIVAWVGPMHLRGDIAPPMHALILAMAEELREWEHTRGHQLRMFDVHIG